MRWLHGFFLTLLFPLVLVALPPEPPIPLSFADAQALTKIIHAMLTNMAWLEKRSSGPAGAPYLRALRNTASSLTVLLEQFELRDRSDVIALFKAVSPEAEKKFAALGSTEISGLKSAIRRFRDQSEKGEDVKNVLAEIELGLATLPLTSRLPEPRLKKKPISGWTTSWNRIRSWWRPWRCRRYRPAFSNALNGGTPGRKRRPSPPS